MNQIFPVSVLFLSVLLTSCYRSIEIDNFDAERWKKDTAECKTYRPEAAKILFEQRDKLIGENESIVLQTLGRPEIYELDKRMHKNHRFSISDCNSDSSAQKLVLEFNSLGQLRFVEME